MFAWLWGFFDKKCFICRVSLKNQVPKWFKDASGQTHKICPSCYKGSDRYFGQARPSYHGALPYEVGNPNSARSKSRERYKSTETTKRKVRYVRTEAGAKRYGVAIGEPIPEKK